MKKGKSETQHLLSNGGAGRSVQVNRKVEFYPRDQFRRTIHLEQKRTERSKRRFALMLVSTSEESPSTKKEIFVNLTRAISLATRETDIAGWQEENETAGVIFTETGDVSAEEVTRILAVRMDSVIREAMTKEQYASLRISFHVFPEDWDEDGSDHVTRAVLYDTATPQGGPGWFSHVVKRAIDILGSLTAMILLTPVTALIALVVKLSSPGPVLFKQDRVGQFGKRFVFLKFRSMRCENDDSVHRDYVKQLIAGTAEAGQGAGKDQVFKIKQDSRVTPVGRILRKTSLDELPQLLNVLRGEMSLVGPRPPIPYEVEHYQIWHRRRLLAVKPGITGLWQVSGRSMIGFDDMVRLDLKYARSWSIWLDLKILAKTPKAVVGGEGAY